MFSDDFILVIIFLIMAILLAVGALILKAAKDDKGAMCASCMSNVLFVIMSFIFLTCWFIEVKKPKAIDVYREKTSLIIEGKDSTVVFGHPTIELSLNQE